MSYCRWSSLRGRCDVYVYEDASGGWTTHVAGLRIPKPLPHGCEGQFDVILNSALSQEEIWRRFKAQQAEDDAHRERFPPQPIGLPHDGASFNDPTPGACAKRLRELRGLGYIVPDFAIEELEEEASTPEGAHDV